MPFRFSETRLPGVLLIEPKVFTDGRGFFMETYKRSEFAARGIADLFVQSNQSRTRRGTVRGLHFQRPPLAQTKLVRVLAGEIFDVAVDLRVGSPTYGKWHGVTLSDENQLMIYVPEGFAHGFCVISDFADVAYMASSEYAPAAEGGLLWSDPDLEIEWPVSDPQLSERDRGWPRLKDVETGFHF